MKKNRYKTVVVDDKSNFNRIVKENAANNWVMLSFKNIQSKFYIEFYKYKDNNLKSLELTVFILSIISAVAFVFALISGIIFVFLQIKFSFPKEMFITGLVFAIVGFAQSILSGIWLIIRKTKARTNLGIIYLFSFLTFIFGNFFSAFSFLLFGNACRHASIEDLNSID